MAHSEVYQRLAWEDRFNEPDVGDLRSALPATTRRLFDSMRRFLLEIEGVEEALTWHGECWRWTLTYRIPASSDPLALLIPSPQDLQLAIPFDRNLLASLPISRLKRAVRDGLELAQEPFDTRWGHWSLQYANLVQELQALIQLKVRRLTK